MRLIHLFDTIFIYDRSLAATVTQVWNARDFELAFITYHSMVDTTCFLKLQGKMASFQRLEKKR